MKRPRDARAPATAALASAIVLSAIKALSVTLIYFAHENGRIYATPWGPKQGETGVKGSQSCDPETD